MKKIILGILAISAMACQSTTSSVAEEEPITYHPVVYNGSNHVDWSKNANIYELNTRQFTPEGTFKALLPHLERIQAMGVNVIWFMPVQPIGVKNRKGGLGSYYSIKDYTGINPEYGTKEDFQMVIDSAHALNMKVILDWVANHSAWDNQWATDHPTWYEQDSTGNFVSPFDWTDVIALNYDNEEMQQEMIKSMQYWVREMHIDGFRCDVASEVPTPFWNKARLALDSIQPVFMLAEAEAEDLHQNAFDMSYAWEFHHVSKEVAQGKKPLSALDTILAKDQKRFGPHGYRLMFTTNHDENSWNGIAKERYGNALELSEVLMYTIYGNPLVYSGQEAGFDKELRFFDKDTIEWKTYEKQEFIMTLLDLNRRNKALWNGAFGGPAEKIQHDQTDSVYAYSRTKDTDEVLVFLNYGTEVTITTTEGISGKYANVFTQEVFEFDSQKTFVIPTSGYLVLEKL